MSNQQVIPRENVFFASCWNSLEDLAKSPFITPRHIHYQFTYQEYELYSRSIKRRLIEVGITSLSFRDHEIIELSDKLNNT